jgi:hypothetical protein
LPGNGLLRDHGVVPNQSQYLLFSFGHYQTSVLRVNICLLAYRVQGANSIAALNRLAECRATGARTRLRLIR